MSTETRDKVTSLITRAFTLLTIASSEEPPGAADRAALLRMVIGRLETAIVMLESGQAEDGEP